MIATQDGLKTLITRSLQQGDLDAFNELHRRLSPTVLRMCRAKLDNPDLAEDATQATFILLHKKGRKIKDEAALMTWLWRTADFVCRQAARAERRKTRFETPMPDEFDVASETQNPNQSDQVNELFAALARLSDKDRTLLTLRYFNGLTVEQIAIEVKASVSATQMRLSRALEQLRKRLVVGGTTLSAVALTQLLTSASAEAAVAVPLAAPLAHVGGQAIVNQVSGLLNFIAFAKTATISTVVGVAAVTTGMAVVKQMRPDPFRDFKRGELATREFGDAIEGRYRGKIRWMSSENVPGGSDVAMVIDQQTNPPQVNFRIEYAVDNSIEEFSVALSMDGKKALTREGILDVKRNGDKWEISGAAPDFPEGFGWYSNRIGAGRPEAGKVEQRLRAIRYQVEPSTTGLTIKTDIETPYKFLNEYTLTRRP